MWSLLETCIRDLDEPIRRGDIVRWFREHHPEVNERTLGVHIQGAVENAPNRATSQFSRRAPLLRRTDHGLYAKATGDLVPELSPDSAEPPSPSPSPSGRIAADLVLIGCVKTKQARADRAADLFVSPLFAGRRAYAEGSGLPWYVLSAKYGLLAPDDVIGPYDVYLPDQPAGYRRAWGQFVGMQLASLLGDLRGLMIEVHAGAVYLDPLRSPLEELGARLSAPLGHLRLGEQLAWYGITPPPDEHLEAADDRLPRTEVAALTAELTEQRRSRTPTEFLASDRQALDKPGLYTWWVDGPGARDLTAGLGERVAAGLIYAGQAGARRWPSGRRSTSTLWTRISGMHLGGRARFSTFRRSLAAALGGALNLTDDDDPQLDTWIEQHLRVITVPVADVDELGQLEATVLAVLDPPLNLDGRPATPLRERLRERRASRPLHDDKTDDGPSPGPEPTNGGRESAGRMVSGTYREGDGASVDFDAARAAWADAGREVLISVARRYHAVITYAELAEEVQRSSGIRTRMLMMHWIGGVLGRVADECQSRHEPLLSALCVHQDGTVGDGYGGAVETNRGYRPDDLDEHAAEERLACHLHFGAALPPDGGRPALTPQLAARRERQIRQQAPAPALCPTCHTQLPLSGQCDTCT
ncbi:MULTISPECIES: DUF6884 domain-containing protein [Pseudofrankia]|uniref:DUF6884 domain-containing protein n=1 Tax=Pseudofrankia TaxID=2994363 RepID=UPI0012FEC60E|nr:MULTISPECIES: DUF6884 domain-containing protein [Pseudofrankia]